MADSEYRISAWWVLPISAVAWWICGFLPWLMQLMYELSGFAEGATTGVVGFLPVPLTADDAMVGLVTMALFGGLLAGATSRLPASAGAGAGAAISGTLLGMAAAVGGSWWLVVRGGAPDDAVPLGMLVATGAAGILGLGLGLLTGLAPAALRGPALALPVVLLDGWLWGLVPGHAVAPVGTWWILAVALGIAFGLAVDSKPIELLGWLPTAGIVWVLQAAGPALVAVQEGIRPGSPLADDALTAARNLWDEIAPAAIVSEGHQLGAWVVALLLGAAIAALRLSREAEVEGEGELAEAWA